MKLFNKILIGVAGFGALAGIALAGDERVKEHTGPSSNIAWDVPQLLFVLGGDPERGKELNTKMMCYTCHGKEGVSAARNWPSIAGQKANYTYKMLIDYRDEKRVDTETSSLMVKLAKTMSEQDMADIAAYYASFPLPPATRPKLASKEAVQKIIPLLTDGDGKRMLPPCFLCHESGRSGDGRDTPAILGQRAEYFRKTMQEYKNGSRHNDIYARMRHISAALSNEEIDALAQYFAQMK